jgi:hypothetical protein
MCVKQASCNAKTDDPAESDPLDRAHDGLNVCPSQGTFGRTLWSDMS